MIMLGIMSDGSTTRPDPIVQHGKETDLSAEMFWGRPRPRRVSAVAWNNSS